jgi:rhamnose utilization protein RhaD (predicted bifunctional aldolase and dehydrogenase)
LRAFNEAIGENPTINYFVGNEIISFSRRTDAKKMLASGVLTPDELVYANGAAMWVDKVNYQSISKKLTRQIQKGKKHSIAFLVRDVGLFVAGERKIAETVRDVVIYSMFIRINANRMGGIWCLNKRQQDFINNWEAEAFRKQLASKTK